MSSPWKPFLEYLGAMFIIAFWLMVIMVIICYIGMGIVNVFALLFTGHMIFA